MTRTDGPRSGSRFLACVAVLVFSQAVNAQSAKKIAYDIPAQSLESALMQFGVQSQRQVVFDPDTVPEQPVPRLKGEYTPLEALAILIGNSGLTYVITADDTIVVRRTTTAASTTTVIHLAQADTSAFVSQGQMPFDAAADEKPIRLEEVFVTGSRIKRDGFSAPTPTTVINAEEMRLSGATDLGSALNDAPQFRATQDATGPRSFQSGMVTADLRGLDAVRTLVLVDGKRPVRTTAGAFNLNLLPFNIVERTEVVTGGASAAWGSDAVAGVVNVILDGDFEGFKSSGQYGVSSRGDGDKYELAAAFGSSFGDGRGHLVLAGEFVEDKGVTEPRARPWTDGWGTIQNPAYTPTNGQPQFLLLPDVGHITSRGGLITNVTGPGGGPQHPLVGTTFLPDGTPTPYQYGSIQSGGFMAGGDNISADEYGTLSVPGGRENVYGLATFDITPAIELRGDLLLARTDATATRELDQFGGGAQPLTISRSNAFLPQSVRDQLAPGQSLQLTRLNDDFNGVPQNLIDNELAQGSVSLNGNLESEWQWDVYYTYGRNQNTRTRANQIVAARFNEAVDSILIDGVPTCRSGNPACVPLDLFGEGAPSPDALAYFQQDLVIDTISTLQAAAASMTGSVASTWAGPLSVAFGAEWRQEQIELESDATAENNGYRGQNPKPSFGQVSVREAFGEAVIPLVANAPLVELLEINGAVRLSDYSNSGRVDTWKGGVNWQMFDDLRLRATRSRDIRAPIISELVGTGSTALLPVFDPVTNVRTPVPTLSNVNPDLEPEKADTVTLGAVYRPSFLRGVSLSLDYYSIDISDYIESLTGQNIVDRCFGGAAELCSLITRGAANEIVQIDAKLLNIARYQTSGVDAELSYVTQDFLGMLPGQFSSRLIASFVNEKTLDDGSSAPVNMVGDLNVVGETGVPKWRGTWSNSYRLGQTMVNLRLRYLSGGVRDSTLSIDKNALPSQTYVDLGFEQTLDVNGGDGTLVLYGNVRNLLDKDPPVSPSGVTYDVIGRYMTVGVRLSL